MSFSHYLKTLMTNVTVTNRELLFASLALREARATNALASVKLAKVRRAVEADAGPVREVIEATSRAHATKDAANQPVRKTAPGGAPLFLLSTGTPAYEFAPDPAAALDAELAPLLEASVTLTIAPFTAADLGAIELADSYGDALLPFVALD